MQFSSIIDARIVAYANGFQAAAHGAKGQFRKYTCEPYSNHPVEVAKIILDNCKTQVTTRMVCAALLHDVIEDTDITEEVLLREFGDDVATLVMQLTEVSRPHHGNRAARKAIDLAHYAQGSAEAQTIKLADMISNTRSIVEHDPDFASVYLPEKLKLVDALKKGDPTLRGLCFAQIAEGMTRLNALRAA